MSGRGNIHEDWFRRDVCHRMRSGSQQLPGPTMRGVSHATALSRTKVGIKLLELMRGNSSGRWKASEDPFWVATQDGGITTAGLWVAGQLVHHVRAAAGRCAQERTRLLLANASAVIPAHTPQTSPLHVPEPQPRQRARLSARRRAAALQRTQLPPLAPRPAAVGVAAAPNQPTIATLRQSHPLRIAVHVRRGDACERWAQRGDSSTDPRPCFPAREYIESARALVKAMTRPASTHVTLLLATDSPLAEHEFVREIAITWPEAAVVHVRTARGAGWGGVAEGAVTGKAEKDVIDDFIEVRNDRGLVDRAAVISSLLADLELLAGAEAFVGTASSWTSRLVLFSVIGELGRVPPFALLDRPLKQLWFA